MEHLPDSLVSDLRSLIVDLGKDGGMISPSIYDTAQGLRFNPPCSGVTPALEWLLVQQRPDGGWGSPNVPRTRDVPTLACILALYTYRHELDVSAEFQAGISFIERQAQYWNSPLSEDLPVGMELILPRLLRDAVDMGLEIPDAHYAALIPVARLKTRQIAALKPGAATPPTFSWEAWGTCPDPRLLDASGGVGHNPAATAFWLYMARDRPDLIEERAAAQNYLASAARATGSHIPGVLPSAWPIDRFEQIFVLHTLLVAGLLDHPQIQDVVGSQLQDLARAIKPTGIGFSDYFVHDGDNTAAAIAVLKQSGRDANYSGLTQFEQNAHFAGYPGELQLSHTVTARSVHTLSLFYEDVTRANDFIMQQQDDDGRWPGDKWNTSWLYGTCLAVFALKHTLPAYCPTLQSAVRALETSQNPDGGWGPDGLSLSTDTAYGALALFILRDCGTVNDDVLRRAHRWLVKHYQPFNRSIEHSWLNKLQYAPYRIDWGFEMSTMMALQKVVSA